MRKFCKNTTGNPDFYPSYLPRWPRSQELKNLRALVYEVSTPWLTFVQRGELLDNSRLVVRSYMYVLRGSSTVSVT